MEDLDPRTSSPDHEQAQLDDLRAVGVDWDEPVLRQSDRFAAHHRAIRQLEAAGLTYPCFCTRREIAAAARAPHGDLPEGAYPGTCRDLPAAERARRAEVRPAALRLRAGGAVVGFVDRVAGPFEAVVDDVVLRRNDGVPSYNLAVVVDDAHQGVTQVLRGGDLLVSTPRQIHLQRLLGLPTPDYAHVPLVLNVEGDRLSKRDGAVTLPDLATLGWSGSGVALRLLGSLGVGARGMIEASSRFDLAAVPREPFVYRPAEWARPAPSHSEEPDHARPRSP
jgi:glutamyl-tRNA synthetase